MSPYSDHLKYREPNETDEWRMGSEIQQAPVRRNSRALPISAKAKRMFNDATDHASSAS
jgi:hypothetical protein